MPFSDENTVVKLAQIAETLATGECEGKAHGHPECLKLYEDENEWCLRCLAKRAWEEFLNGQS